MDGNFLFGNCFSGLGQRFSTRDDVRIRRVLISLISNAIKSHPLSNN